jgi:pimeloyl-ACP methyl ester carboxylesterase
MVTWGCPAVLAAGQAPAGVQRIVAQGAPAGSLAAPSGASPKTRYLDRGEGRIAFDLAGTGPLVICAPGMGDVRAEYRFLVPQLVEAGYAVATMDVRGQGESSAAWKDYSVAAIGADMLALARHLYRGPAILAANSMSGAAAVWAAAEAPDAVAGLVLLDPVVRDAPSGTGPLARALYSVLFADPWGPAVWQRYYGTLYPSRKPADFAAYTAALAANLRQAGRMRALRGMMLSPKAAAEARVSQVKAPALVVMGTRDPDFKDPVAETRWLSDALHARVQLIEGAGHYPHAERPDETGPAVVAFLQTIAAKEPYGQ